MSDSGGEPVFIISVAARLLEMHPQTLRKYEREGLIAPSRTVGKFRLYSDEDLARLRQVKHLVGVRGLNLAGVQMALEATEHVRAMRKRIGDCDDPEETLDRERLRHELDRLMALLGAAEPGAR